MKEITNTHLSHFEVNEKNLSTNSYYYFYESDSALFYRSSYYGDSCLQSQTINSTQKWKVYFKNPEMHIQYLQISLVDLDNKYKKVGDVVKSVYVSSLRHCAISLNRTAATTTDIITLRMLIGSFLMHTASF